MIINYVDSFPRETLLLCLFWIQIKRARLQRNVNHRYIRFVSAKQWLHFDGTNFLIQREKLCSPSRMAWFTFIFPPFISIISLHRHQFLFFQCDDLLFFQGGVTIIAYNGQFLRSFTYIELPIRRPTEPNQTKPNQIKPTLVWTYASSCTNRTQWINFSIKQKHSTTQLYAQIFEI